MPSIKIDGKLVTVAKGSTILNACQKLGIKIPTLCYLAEYEHHTSCMICVVKDKQDNRLLPSCAALVRDGMEIETRGAELDLFRKSTLELLLSEHLGDCEAPCRRACPAYMDIPVMIEKIKQNDLTSALAIVKEHLPFPAISARICPAPCQKACRRKHHDGSVHIRLLVRFMVDREAELNIRSQKIKTGKQSVAIVGAGVTGLSAAYYLLQAGYRCTVLDKNPQPWGGLLAEVAGNKLPKEILKLEIDKLSGMGLVLKQKTELGKDISFKQLKKEYNAIILALGQVKQTPAYLSFLQAKGNKPLVRPSAFQTSQPTIFAGGALVGHRTSAVKAMAQGKAMAIAVEQYLTGKAVQRDVKEFDCHLGRLLDGELQEFLKKSAAYAGVIPKRGEIKGYLLKEAQREASRCLQCDCAKKKDCRLRDYCQQYNADWKHYREKERPAVKIIDQHTHVLFEPGKCIKCGRCVRITRKAGEKLGLGFVGRGFNIKVAVPFNRSLQQGLKKAARDCVEACPTGALVFKNQAGKE